MDWAFYIAAIVGGLIAGFINTLAGNGSAITLSILTELVGLPGNIANATNRIGITGQSIAGTYIFYKEGKLDLKRGKWPFILMVLGSFAGIYTATIVSNEQFLFVFKYLMILMLVVVLVGPKKWIKEYPEKQKDAIWLFPIYIAIGFYGGFIQMGMGLFFLATLVLLGHYSIIKANALKALIVGVYTFIALVIFHFKGLVRWDIGLVLAVGQIISGWYTARYASRFQSAGKVAYYLLVIMVGVALLKLFDVF